MQRMFGCLRHRLWVLVLLATPALFAGAVAAEPTRLPLGQQDLRELAQERGEPALRRRSPGRRLLYSVVLLVFVGGIYLAFWGETYGQKLAGRCVVGLMLSGLAYWTFNPGDDPQPGRGFPLGVATMVVLICWALTIKTRETTVGDE